MGKTGWILAPSQSDSFPDCLIQELQSAGFGPVCVADGDKAEVAAAVREFQVEMGIGFGFFSRKTLGTEEGIIEGIDEECRHGDPGE